MFDSNGGDEWDLIFYELKNCPQYIPDPAVN